MPPTSTTTTMTMAYFFLVMTKVLSCANLTSRGSLNV